MEDLQFSMLPSSRGDSVGLSSGALTKCSCSMNRETPCELCLCVKDATLTLRY